MKFQLKVCVKEYVPCIFVLTRHFSELVHRKTSKCRFGELFTFKISSNWQWQIILLIFTSDCFWSTEWIKFLMIMSWLFFTSFLMEGLRSFSLQTLMSIVIIVIRFLKIFLIRSLAARDRGLTPRPLHLLQVLLHLVLHHATKLLDTNLSLGRMSKTSNEKK